MANKITVELDEMKLKELVFEYLEKELGGVTIKPEDVKILVMTKENYRATQWEHGKFKATVEVNL